MLVFWTAANPSSVRQTIGRTLSSFKPVPKHRFAPFKEGVYEAQAGELVVACGTKPLTELQKAGVVPKNRTITSLRGKVFQGASGAYMLTFDPGVVDREPEKGQDIDWDVRLAERYARTGSISPKFGEYRWVDDFSELIDAIKCRYEKTGKPVDVAGDTETMGLHPWYPDKRIVCIGFTMEAGRADAVYFTSRDLAPKLRQQIEWLLNSPMVSMKGANFKFDLIWIAETWGIECTNFRMDTLLVGSLIDENRSNSLNIHVKTYATDLGGYDDAFNEKYDKSRMELVPKDELLLYHGGDVDGTLRCANVLKGELLRDAALARFYVKLLHPAARAFEKVERRGVLVDVPKLQKLGEDLQEEIERLTEEAFKLMPRRLRLKYADNLSLSRPAILKDYFFSPLGLNLTPIVRTPKSGEPSTAKAHLQMFAHVPEAAAMCGILEEINSASKTLSTYVVGFLKHLRPDGRFHPTYMLFHGGYGDDEEEAGTVTGRLSAKDPAVQTIPKKTKWAKRLRECFPAPPGKVFFSVDFNQGELRVVACVAPEPTMLAAYKKGLDLHAVTGAKLGGYVFEEFMKLKETDPDLFDLIRGKAKPANFGLLYGMMVDGFMAYAWANYKLRLSREEAQKIIDAFFELYPGLTDYHEKQRKFVRQYGYAVSPLGRVRHLPHIRSRDWSVVSRAERQAINSPIQSTLTDMMCYAMALIEEQLDTDRIEVVGMTHDNIYGYVPEDTAEEDIAKVVAVMSNLPLHEFDWHPPLAFPADAEMGPDMGHLEKMKVLKLAA